jgi:hypothetical protein
MFGDNGRHDRKFSDLMPANFMIIGTRFAGQGFVATIAGFRSMNNDFVDASLMQANSMMPAMPCLATAFATGGRFDDRLGSVERIGRRRRGAIGRVAFELFDKFFDLSFKNGDTRQRGIEFSLKASTVGAIRA